MPSFLVPKNWGEFQHYKDRSPPWIRLHKRLLDDYDFQSLPVASRALAPMLWLLASDSADLKSGSIEFAPEKIAFRLRMAERDLIEALKPLLDKGFFEVIGDAIDLLAERKQDAVPETETETEESQRQKKARVPRFDAQAHLESLGVDSSVARDWLTLRSGKRLKPTETAFSGVRQEAQKAGMSMDDALRLCCKRGWGGFESAWVAQAQQGMPSARASPSGWQEKNEATIAALTGRDKDHDLLERIIDV